MPLKITKKLDTLYLKGDVTNKNYKSLINFIEYNLRLEKNVIINIDNVKEIDKVGFKALKKLLTFSLNNHKLFSIEGSVKQAI